MGRIPTVKIHDPNKLGDFRIINESELDLSVQVEQLLGVTPPPTERFFAMALPS